jgi:hypothetical protein
MSNYITPPPNINLNLQNNHPLIPREDIYWLNRKCLTVHSQDRDFSKWPFPNEFEINLPEDYNNIQSTRLIEFTFPVNLYNFSNVNQNTHFKITINNYVNWIKQPEIFPDTPISIFIDDGYYTKEQLANTLTFKLNKKITAKNDPDKNFWKVIYHEVKQKFLIGNNFGIDFTLDADVSFNYYNICCNLLTTNRTGLNCNDGTTIGANNQPRPNMLPPTVNYFQRYNKWGFLAYIGYTDKIPYHSKKLEPGDSLYLDYEPPDSIEHIWLPANKDYDSYFSEPPFAANIIGEQAIYMEMNYFNNIDELVPWPDSSYNIIRKGYSGNKEYLYYEGKPPEPNVPKYVAYRGSGVNSSFAKIPIISIPNTENTNSENGQLLNSTQFTPPLERINRLKFKFRYHDGRPVDFQNAELTFTLEFNMLRNDFDRKLTINTPQFYSWT